MYLFFGTLGLAIAFRGLIEASPSSSHVLYNSSAVSNPTQIVVSTPNDIYSREPHEKFSEKVLTRRKSNDLDLPDFPTDFAPFGSGEETMKVLVELRRSFDLAIKQIPKYSNDKKRNGYVSQYIKDIFKSRLRKGLKRIDSEHLKTPEDAQKILLYLANLSMAMKQFRNEVLKTKPLLVETDSLNKLIKGLNVVKKFSSDFLKKMVEIMPPKYDNAMKEYAVYIEKSIATVIDVIGAKTNQKPIN